MDTSKAYRAEANANAEANAEGMYRHQFAHCRLDISLSDNDAGKWPVAGLAVVTFSADGATTTARPHLTEAYLAHAERAGYGTDVAAFVCEHELAHAWLGELMGYGYSRVQWNDAHGIQNLPLIVEEERLVRWWQRYVNTGSGHKGRLQPLLDMGLDLEELRAEWLALTAAVFGRSFWWQYREGSKE